MAACSNIWQYVHIICFFMGSNIIATFRFPRPVKPFNLGDSANSSVQSYFHDQLIAILTTSGDRLVNCTLVEVLKVKERDAAINLLQARINVTEVNFERIFEMMRRCHSLDDTGIKQRPVSFLSAKFALIRGIFPGTKWCGNRDIADNYHDLGSLENLDACCRQHDLCPSKVTPFTYNKEYALYNPSSVSRSHCDCDFRFSTCLRNVSTPESQFINKVFFKIMRPPCLWPCTSQQCKSRYVYLRPSLFRR